MVMMSAGLAAIAAVGSPQIVSAATTNTWTGGSSSSSNWSDAANWSAGVPTSGQALSFPSGASRLANVNDVAGLSVDSITLTGSGYDISGNSITLQAGITLGTIPGRDRLSTPLTIAAAQTWNLPGDQSGQNINTLEIGGAVSGSAPLTINGNGGGGHVQFQAASSYSGHITITSHADFVVLGDLSSAPVTLNTGFMIGGGAVGGVDGVGTVVPGTNVSGTLHSEGDFSLGAAGSAASDFAIVFATSSNGTTTMYLNNSLDVHGTVKLTNVLLDLACAALDGNCVPANEPKIIVNNDGTDPVTGVFSDFKNPSQKLPEGATFKSQDGNATFRISYKGGTGNDITLTRLASNSQSEAQVTPSTVAPGQQVTVSGAGFAPNQPLTATLSGDPNSFGTATSDASGNFTLTATVPSDTTAGQHSIVVSGPAPGGGTHDAVGTLNVAAAVSPGETSSAAQVTPGTVTPGQTVTVTGGGFAPNQPLTVTLSGDPNSFGTATSDASGNFTLTAAIPTNTSIGQHSITVSGQGPNGGTHRAIGTVTVVAVAAPATAVTATPSFAG